MEVYEWFAAEYGWTAAYLEANVTDEQFALYAEKAEKRRKAQAFAELDRIVSGASWGFGIALDPKKRVVRRWESIRRKALRSTSREKGLTGAALENAVMAIAMADPSLVKIEQRGA